MTENLQ